MPVTAEWDNPEKTITRMRFIGAWTWDEVADAVKARNALIAEVSHVVASIIDLREATGLPIASLATAVTQRFETPSNLHTSVIVGASSQVKALYNIFVKLRGHDRLRYHMADDDTGAYQIIEQAT